MDQIKTCTLYIDKKSIGMLKMYGLLVWTLINMLYCPVKLPYKLKILDLIFYFLPCLKYQLLNVLH